MMRLNRQSEQFKVGANCHLIEAMGRIEERDRERLHRTRLN
jgi:hypothetical protein